MRSITFGNCLQLCFGIYTWVKGTKRVAGFFNDVLRYIPRVACSAPRSSLFRCVGLCYTIFKACKTRRWKIFYEYCLPNEKRQPAADEIYRRIRRCRGFTYSYMCIDFCRLQRRTQTVLSFRQFQMFSVLLVCLTRGNPYTCNTSIHVCCT